MRIECTHIEIFGASALVNVTTFNASWILPLDHPDLREASVIRVLYVPNTTLTNFTIRTVGPLATPFTEAGLWLLLYYPDLTLEQAFATARGALPVICENLSTVFSDETGQVLHDDWACFAGLPSSNSLQRLLSVVPEDSLARRLYDWAIAQGKPVRVEFRYNRPRNETCLSVAVLIEHAASSTDSTYRLKLADLVGTWLLSPPDTNYTLTVSLRSALLLSYYPSGEVKEGSVWGTTVLVFNGTLPDSAYIQYVPTSAPLLVLKKVDVGYCLGTSYPVANVSIWVHNMGSVSLANISLIDEKARITEGGVWTIPYPQDEQRLQNTLLDELAPGELRLLTWYRIAPTESAESGMHKLPSSIVRYSAYNTTLTSESNDLSLWVHVGGPCLLIEDLTYDLFVSPGDIPLSIRVRNIGSDPAENLRVEEIGAHKDQLPRDTSTTLRGNLSAAWDLLFSKAGILAINLTVSYTFQGQEIRIKAPSAYTRLNTSTITIPEIRITRTFSSTVASSTTSIQVNITVENVGSVNASIKLYEKIPEGFTAEKLQNLTRELGWLTRETDLAAGESFTASYRLSTNKSTITAAPPTCVEVGPLQFRGSCTLLVANLNATISINTTDLLPGYVVSINLSFVNQATPPLFNVQIFSGNMQGVQVLNTTGSDRIDVLRSGQQVSIIYYAQVVEPGCITLGPPSVRFEVANRTYWFTGKTINVTIPHEPYPGVSCNYYRVAVGKPFSVKIAVSNPGYISIVNVSVSIELSPNLALAEGSPFHQWDHISGRDTEYLDIVLIARKPGDAWIRTCLVNYSFNGQFFAPNTTAEFHLTVEPDPIHTYLVPIVFAFGVGLIALYAVLHFRIEKLRVKKRRR